MIVVTHFEVPSDSEDFAARGETALAALAARPGFVRGHLGRSTDDVSAWIVVTEWANVGAYRRALGAFEVRISANGLLAEALDIPSSFEALVTVDDTGAMLHTGSDRRLDDSGERAPHF
jgi:hypothetical protein